MSPVAAEASIVVVVLRAVESTPKVRSAEPEIFSVVAVVPKRTVLAEVEDVRFKVSTAPVITVDIVLPPVALERVKSALSAVPVTLFAWKVKVAPTLLSLTLSLVAVSAILEIVPAAVDPISVKVVTPVTFVALKVLLAASNVRFIFSTFLIDPGVTDVARLAFRVSVPEPPSTVSSEFSVFPPEEVKPALNLFVPDVPSRSSTLDVRL
jgi:hypothetical protein